MKRFLCLLLCIGLIFCTGLTACSPKEGLNPGNPVTLTMWHNYGGVMKETMDSLVDEFNQTVGKDKGVVLNITSISDSASIQEKLLMIAAGDPGAPELPDITTCYPKTALQLAERGLLLDLTQQFTQEELDAYLPRFVEEGRFGDALYVFPTAKSTEVLFLNQTLFDRFAQAAGVTSGSLATFEGIAQAAEAYCRWTDSLTPDQPGDGKAFYVADSWFNLAQVGMKQLGEDFVDPAAEALDLASPAFRQMAGTLFRPAILGGIAVFDGYSSDLSKTGDILCSTGSTAGILFYGTTITYPDNTSEEVEYTVLPYPVFAGGEKIAIQRGSGVCVARSTPEKEEAAALFLKWFTAPEQNMRFISSTGYLPVTNAAFGDIMERKVANVEVENIGKLLSTAITMQKEYDFYIPPTFDSFDALGKDFERAFKDAILAGREEYARLLAEGAEDALDQAAAFAVEALAAH